MAASSPMSHNYKQELTIHYQTAKICNNEISTVSKWQDKEAQDYSHFLHKRQLKQKELQSGGTVGQLSGVDHNAKKFIYDARLQFISLINQHKLNQANNESSVSLCCIWLVPCRCNIRPSNCNNMKVDDIK